MKLKTLFPLIFLLVGVSCSKDNPTPSEVNSDGINPNWEQTIPGNIVGKYSTKPGVPTIKEFEGVTYHYAWSEEYKGDELNERDWQYEVNGDGGGNGEKQYYLKANGVVKDDLLTIYGKHESFGNKAYTSARMTTKNKVYFTYGYVEAMIQIPSFKGAWPAFWMLGQSISDIGWSACGEIDIMEAVNEDQYVHSTLHYGTNHRQSTIGKLGFKSTIERMDWHKYEMVWNEQFIATYVDGMKIGQIDITPQAFEAFHQEFFFIVNLAIGGSWPGSVDTKAFNIEQTMKVDYIRVYQTLGGEENEV